MTRTPVVALLVLALGVLAGCGPFGDDEPAAQDRAGRVLTAAQAKSALPSVASLPKGWRAAKPGLLRPKSAVKDKVTPARCRPLDVDFVSGYLQSKNKSFASFLNPRRQNVMGIGIASYSGAAPGLDAIRTALKSCTAVVVRTPEEVQRATVRPLSIPSLGHDAVSIRLKLRTSEYAATYDAIRVRVGHNWLMGDLVTPGPARPNAQPLVTAMKNALLNLS